MAQYNGAAIIPVETVCRDYFSHLTVDKFVRKVSPGEIRIPLVRMEASQKAAKGVHLTATGCSGQGVPAAATLGARMLPQAGSATPVLHANFIDARI